MLTSSRWVNTYTYQLSMFGRDVDSSYPNAQPGMLHLILFQSWPNAKPLSAISQKHVSVLVRRACIYTLGCWSNAHFLLWDILLDVSLMEKKNNKYLPARLRVCGKTWKYNKNVKTNVNISMFLKMKTVRLALQHFQKPLKGYHVLVWRNNTTVVFYINHQGGTSGKGCCCPLC